MAALMQQMGGMPSPNAMMMHPQQGNQVWGGVNTGLNMASAIPGPQQPFVAAGSMVSQLANSMFGKKV